MGMVEWWQGPQSLAEGVGRAVLCPPKGGHGCAAACRGLPALPSMTDRLRERGFIGNWS